VTNAALERLVGRPKKEASGALGVVCGQAATNHAVTNIAYLAFPRRICGGASARPSQEDLVIVQV